MQRRRFLAGAAGGAFACLLSGCGEGVNARRIALNGTLEGEEVANSADVLREQGLVLLDYEFYRQESSAGVRGTVENRANVDFDFVAAYVRFFDQSGTRIGQASDYKSGLPAGEKWTFNARLLDTDPSNVARYRLVVVDQRSTEIDPFRNDSS